MLPSLEEDNGCLRLCDIVQFHSPISGGIRRYVGDKARFFSSQENVRHAVLIPGPENRTWKEGKTTWVQLASPRMPGSDSYRLFLSKGGIHRFLEGFGPHLIEVADPYQSTWMALSWARSKRVPVLLFYHSDYPRAWHRTVKKYVGSRPAGLARKMTGWYLGKLLMACNGILVSTRKYERLWKERTQTPVARVPFGFDDNVFYPRPGQGILRDLLPPERRSSPVLLFAGRLAREKRIGDVLEAYAILRRERPDAHLVIVGDGEDRLRLQRKSQDLANPVTWLPFTQCRETMAAYYSEATALVHAGTHETFGYSVLEAAACGTPAVIFNGSGLEEAAHCHPLARVVPHRNPHAMASEMRVILNMINGEEQRWRIHTELAAVRSLHRSGQRWLETIHQWVGHDAIPVDANRP
jgi:alpha-1,6-mannosyltransferase